MATVHSSTHWRWVYTRRPNSTIGCSSRTATGSTAFTSRTAGLARRAASQASGAGHGNGAVRPSSRPASAAAIACSAATMSATVSRSMHECPCLRCPHREGEGQHDLAGARGHRFCRGRRRGRRREPRWRRTRRHRSTAAARSAPVGVVITTVTMPPATTHRGRGWSPLAGATRTRRTTRRPAWGWPRRSSRARTGRRRHRDARSGEYPAPSRQPR